MVTKHIVLRNGAVLSLYRASGSDERDPVTLIVAGQHGNETGPIEALTGWHPRFSTGSVAVVRLANPIGYALGSRYACDEMRDDLNRGWGSGPVQAEVWKAVWSEFGRMPDLVLDLHSSRRPWSCPGAGKHDVGRSLLAVGPKALAVALTLLGDVAEDGWTVFDHDSQQGTLARFATSEGTVGITVEFDESIAADLALCGEPAGHSPQLREVGLRKRSRHERTLGVLTFVERVVKRLHGQV